MLDQEILTLASAAASKLVGAMLTDGWETIKKRFARINSVGGDQGYDDTLHRLEASQNELELAGSVGDEVARTELEEEWRARIRRILVTRPDLQAELKAIIGNGNDDTAKQSIETDRTTLSAQASDNATVIQQGQGNQHNIISR